jgi:type II secretory pathway pseudopilin PulG
MSMETNEVTTADVNDDMIVSMAEPEPVEAAPEAETAVPVVETEAAPVAPAAVAPAPVAGEEVFDIEPVEPVAAPAQAVPAASTRVGRFKKEDKLDEAALEQVLERSEVAHAYASEVAALYERDEQYRLSYLEALDRNGKLRPEYRAEMAELRTRVKPAAEAASAVVDPKAEEDAVVRQSLALRAQGKDDEADRLLRRSAIDQAKKEMAAELAPRVGKIENAEQERLRAQTTQQAHQNVQSEIQQLSKAYPKLVKVENGKVVFLCKKFEKGFAENYRPDMPLLKIAKFTLSEQGRLGAKPQGVKPAVAPPPEPAAPRAPKKQNQDDDMLVVTIGD